MIIRLIRIRNMQGCKKRKTQQIGKTYTYSSLFVTSLSKWEESKHISVKSMVWYSPRLNGADLSAPSLILHSRTLSLPQETILDAKHVIGSELRSHIINKNLQEKQKCRRMFINIFVSLWNFSTLICSWELQHRESSIELVNHWHGGFWCMFR